MKNNHCHILAYITYFMQNNWYTAVKILTSLICFIIFLFVLLQLRPMKFNITQLAINLKSIKFENYTLLLIPTYNKL